MIEVYFVSRFKGIFYFKTKSGPVFPVKIPEIWMVNLEISLKKLGYKLIKE